jgi:hypothetical protein
MEVKMAQALSFPSQKPFLSSSNNALGRRRGIDPGTAEEIWKKVKQNSEDLKKKYK